MNKIQIHFKGQNKTHLNFSKYKIKKSTKIKLGCYDYQYNNLPHKFQRQ